jgi:hypothetical protein
MHQTIETTMYEIPLTVGRRYRRGVRRTLNDLPLGYSEERGFWESHFVVRTPCKDLMDILLDLISENTARNVL